MNLGRCPVCHSRLHLDALVQDEAGRELLGLLAGLNDRMGRALVVYLGLFRSPTRDLANDRALRLARGVLELDAGACLVEALNDTVEALRNKGGAPLTDHNYLKKVIDTYKVKGNQVVVSTPEEPSEAPRAVSKTLGAIAALEGLKRVE